MGITYQEQFQYRYYYTNFNHIGLLGYVVHVLFKGEDIKNEILKMEVNHVWNDIIYSLLQGFYRI